MASSQFILGRQLQRATSIYGEAERDLRDTLRLPAKGLCPFAHPPFFISLSMIHAAFYRASVHNGPVVKQIFGEEPSRHSLLMAAMPGAPCPIMDALDIILRARDQEGLVMRSISLAVGSIALIVAIAALAISIVAVNEGDAFAPSLAPKSHEPGGYTKAFVEQAIGRYEAHGRSATVAYYNTMQSVDGDWYVFILDENDEFLAHATIPDNVGEDLGAPIFTDVNGYYFGADIVDVTEDGRWVDYVYLNPATGEEERKHSWVIRHDGLVFGSGWYEK